MLKPGDIVRLKPQPASFGWEWQTYIIERYGLGPHVVVRRSLEKVPPRNTLGYELDTTEGDPIMTLEEPLERCAFDAADMLVDPFLSAVHRRKHQRLRRDTSKLVNARRVPAK